MQEKELDALLFSSRKSIVETDARRSCMFAAVCLRWC